MKIELNEQEINALMQTLGQFEYGKVFQIMDMLRFKCESAKKAIEQKKVLNEEEPKVK